MNTETPDGLLDRVLRDLLSSTIASQRPDATCGWQEHIPFAFWIVEKLRPGTYVQLGLGDGDAYSAFCQAAERCWPSIACYEVAGAHADDSDALCDESSYQEFGRGRDQQHGGSARVIHLSCEEALAHFPDKGIDLLHIHEQCGAAEGVERDLEMWLPKLSDRAVVLLHTIDSGETQKAHSQWLAGLSRGSSDRSFFFDCGLGLGMLIIGRDVPNVVRQITRLHGDDAALVRLAFQTYGRLVTSQLSESKLRNEAKKMEEAHRLEVANLKSARDAAVRLADDRENSRLASELSSREQLWKAEIERRRLEVESCRAEVHLAERVAISRHTSAEKDRLIAGLQNEKQATTEKDRLIARLQNEKKAVEDELTELRRVHDVVMRSRSMAITKPMRALIDIARRVRR
jgi:hypothetical protein